MAKNDADVLFTLEGAAAYLEVSKEVVLGLLESGEIRGRKLVQGDADSWRCFKSDVDFFIRHGERTFHA